MTMSPYGVAAGPAAAASGAATSSDNNKQNAGHSIFATAMGRWLSVSEIEELLRPESTPLSISTKPPTTPPPSGTLLLFDRNATRNYKDDGHDWIKKKGGARIREDHVKLRVAGRYRIAGSYVHHATVSTMKRRSYHLVDPNTGKAPNRAGISALLANLCASANAGGSAELIGSLGNAIADQRCLVLVHYLDTDLAAKHSAELTAQVMKLREEQKEVMRMALKAAKRERKNRKLLKQQQKEIELGMYPAAMNPVMSLPQNVASTTVCQQQRVPPSRMVSFGTGSTGTGSDDTLNLLWGEVVEGGNGSKMAKTVTSSSSGSMSDSDSSSDCKLPSQMPAPSTLPNKQFSMNAPPPSAEATHPAMAPVAMHTFQQRNLFFHSNNPQGQGVAAMAPALPASVPSQPQVPNLLPHLTQQGFQNQQAVQQQPFILPPVLGQQLQQQSLLQAPHMGFLQNQPPLTTANICRLQNELDQQAVQLHLQNMLHQQSQQIQNTSTNAAAEAEQQQGPQHVSCTLKPSAGTTTTTVMPTPANLANMKPSAAEMPAGVGPASSSSVAAGINESNLEVLWKMVLESVDSGNAAKPADADAVGQGQRSSSSGGVLHGVGGGVASSVPTSFDIEGVFTECGAASSVAVGDAAMGVTQGQQAQPQRMSMASFSSSLGGEGGGGVAAAAAGGRKRKAFGSFGASDELQAYCRGWK